MPHQLVFTDRLDQKAERTALGRLHRLGDRRMAGQYDHRDVRPAALQLLQQRQPVHIVQAQFGDHEIGARPHAGVQCRLPGFCGANRIIRALQMSRHDSTEGRVLVDDQHLHQSL
jgi:hypothetical protein